MSRLLLQSSCCSSSSSAHDASLGLADQSIVCVTRSSQPLVGESLKRPVGCLAEQTDPASQPAVDYQVSVVAASTAVHPNVVPASQLVDRVVSTLCGMRRQTGREGWMVDTNSDPFQNEQHSVLALTWCFPPFPLHPLIRTISAPR